MFYKRDIGHKKVFARTTPRKSLSEQVRINFNFYVYKHGTYVASSSTTTTISARKREFVVPGLLAGRRQSGLELPLFRRGSEPIRAASYPR
jgi:hypothetical protein